MNINWGLTGSLITLLGVFVAIAIYQRSQRNKRIDKFLDNFFKVRTNHARVIEYLIPAGIANLKNDKEIDIALRMLKNRLNMVQHPLRQSNDIIKQIGYKKFFQRAINGPGKLNKNTIQVYIDSSKKS